MIALTGTAHYAVQAAWIGATVTGAAYVLDRVWARVHRKRLPFDQPENLGLPRCHVRRMQRPPYDWNDG